MNELRYWGGVGSINSQVAYCANGTLLKFEELTGVPMEPLDDADAGRVKPWSNVGDVLARIWDNDEDAIFDTWEPPK